MKRVTLAMCVWMLVSMARGAEPAAVHAPRIVCDEAVYNFGVKDNSEQVEHTFTVRNDGDLTLEITRVRPACGCTVAKLSSREVPPGGTAEISTVLSLKGRSGRQRKSIRVESNDPKVSSLMLYLEGEAVTELSMEPRHLYFGQIAQNAAKQQTLVVKSTNPLELTGVSSSQPQFQPRFEKNEADNSWQITVETVPPLPMGGLHGELRIERVDGGVFTVPVSAMVVGPLAVAPQELVLREAEGRAVTRYIIIRPGDVSDFEVLGVKLPMEQMRSTVTSLGGSGYRIQLDDIPAVKELDGKMVEIETSVEAMKTVRIPFKVIAP